MVEYTVAYKPEPVSPECSWNSPYWFDIEPLTVEHARPEGSDHHPGVALKMTHDNSRLNGLFKVDDQYVLSRHTQLHSPVCQDSCVEIFLHPKPDLGYFNFEFNCGGCLLCSYVTDPTRVGGGFREYVRLEERHAREVTVVHSMPDVVDPEIPEPVTWHLSFAIPFAILEDYCGDLGTVAGQTWGANVYKCGDKTSHPHWLSWSPVPELNFHHPTSFGRIRFLGESESMRRQ